MLYANREMTIHIDRHLTDLFAPPAGGVGMFFQWPPQFPEDEREYLAAVTPEQLCALLAPFVDQRTLPVSYNRG